MRVKPIHMLGAAIGAVLAGAWLTYAFVGGFGGEPSGPRDWLIGGGLGFVLGGLALAGLRSPSGLRLALYTLAAVPLGILLVLGTAGGHPGYLACLITIAALLLYAPVLREIRTETRAPTA